MDSQRHDGLDLSSFGTIHEKRSNHRKDAGVEKGFTQGAGLGHANADVFYQSRGKRPQAEAAGRTGKGKNLAFPARATHKPGAQAKDRLLEVC